jgi:hypothetical protein
MLSIFHYLYSLLFLITFVETVKAPISVHLNWYSPFSWTSHHQATVRKQKVVPRLRIKPRPSSSLRMTFFFGGETVCELPAEALPEWHSPALTSGVPLHSNVKAQLIQTVFAPRVHDALLKGTALCSHPVAKRTIVVIIVGDPAMVVRLADKSSCSYIASHSFIC